MVLDITAVPEFAIRVARAGRVRRRLARALSRRERRPGGLTCSRATLSQPTQAAASVRALAIGSAARALSSVSLRAMSVLPWRAGSTRPSSRPPASSGMAK